MARLAIAKGFLAEYAKLDKDARRAVEAVVTEFAQRPHAWRYLEKPGSTGERLRHQPPVQRQPGTRRAGSPRRGNHPATAALAPGGRRARTTGGCSRMSATPT